MITNKCENCREEFKWCLPMTELVWYICNKCKRNVVVMNK